MNTVKSHDGKLSLEDLLRDVEQKMNDENYTPCNTLQVINGYTPTVKVKAVKKPVSKPKVAGKGISKRKPKTASLTASMASTASTKPKPKVNKVKKVEKATATKGNTMNTVKATADTAEKANNQKALYSIHFADSLLTIFIFIMYAFTVFILYKYLIAL